MKHRGYTLIEILVSMSVLLIGLSAVLGVMRSAQRKANDSADLATAQQSCLTTLNELLAAQEPIRPLSGIPINGLPRWSITVEVFPTQYEELRAVAVAAVKSLSQDGETAVMYQLVRWVPSDKIALPQEEQRIDETNDFEYPF
jgi:prepilin-type N-terminal cleavage/methylation domain-containing protein